MASKRDLERLHEGLDELIHDLWRLPGFAGQRLGFQPQIDCYRRDAPAELHVLVELPGVEPQDVRISVEGRVLTVAGERRRPDADCRLSYYRLEIEYGAFARRLTLPEELDVEQTRASFERGMLTIAIPIAPKPQALQTFSIPVQARP